MRCACSTPDVATLLYRVTYTEHGQGREARDDEGRCRPASMLAATASGGACCTRKRRSNDRSREPRSSPCAASPSASSSGSISPAGSPMPSAPACARRSCRPSPTSISTSPRARWWGWWANRAAARARSAASSPASCRRPRAPWRGAARTSRRWAAEDRHAWQLAVQMIFQDPFASLNPRLRVSEIVGEAPRVHGLVARDRPGRNTSPRR